MPEVTVEQPITLDVLPSTEPALSTRNDMPVVETKPDSQPAPKEEAKPEVKAEAAPDEGKKASESATEEQPDEDAAANAGEAGKPKSKGVQKRIDELVKQREDAERRAESERQEKLRLLALVEKGGKQEPPVEEDAEPQRPLREAFETTDEFVAAMAEYADAKADWRSRNAVKAALAEEHRKVEQRHIEEGQRQARESYQARVAKTAEKYPDYKDVAESPDVTVTVAMAQAILHSQHGPEIQYFLGKNPDEAKRISGLNPAEQLVELGLIVGRVSAPKEEPKKEDPPKKKPIVSNAPSPIKPLESTGETANKSPQEESMEEYAARRKKELASERRGVYR